MRVSSVSLIVLHHYISVAQAQASSSAPSCTSTITPQNSAAPSVAPGWQAAVVAKNLTSPRGIKFDSQGGLLVVEQEKGIVRLTFGGEGACVQGNGSTVVIDDASVSPHSRDDSSTFQEYFVLMGS